MAVGVVNFIRNKTSRCCCTSTRLISILSTNLSSSIFAQALGEAGMMALGGALHAVSSFSRIAALALTMRNYEQKH